MNANIRFIVDCQMYAVTLVHGCKLDIKEHHATNTDDLKCSWVDFASFACQLCHTLASVTVCWKLKPV